MAFIRSSRPTISTRNDCRAGMSNALTTPRHVARTSTCQTRTAPVNVSAARMSGRIIDTVCVMTIDAVAPGAIGDGAADRREEEDRREACKRRRAQERRRSGQAKDQPRFGYRLHPRAVSEISWPKKKSR